MSGVVSGLLIGLLGAFLISVSDALARGTARVTAPVMITLIMFSISGAIMTVGIAGAGLWPAWDPWAWTLAAVSGLANTAGLILLYLALARGPVALASPAISLFTVLLVLMNAAAGEPFGALQAAAITLVFWGVYNLSRGEPAPANHEAEKKAEGPAAVGAAPETRAHLRGTLALAFAASVTVALRMFLAQEATDRLGPIEALYLTRVVALVVAVAILLFALSAPRRLGLRPLARPPTRKVWPLILLQTLFELAAIVAFLFAGAGVGDRVAASIGFSAFAAITPLVAWALYGEAVSRRRALWIAVVILGVALASGAG